MMTLNFAVAQVVRFRQNMVQPGDVSNHLCKLCKLLGIRLMYDFDGHLLHIILHAFKHLASQHAFVIHLLTRTFDWAA